MSGCLQNVADYGFYPMGFTGAGGFKFFVEYVFNLSPLPSDTSFAFQGSSVTGRSYSSGQAFDFGRVSDYDLALASPKLYERTVAKGITGPPTEYRTGELQADQLALLYLDITSRQAHTCMPWCSTNPARPVHFLVYRSVEDIPGTRPALICTLASDGNPLWAELQSTYVKGTIA